jgi:hypothetical protein
MESSNACQYISSSPSEPGSLGTRQERDTNSDAFPDFSCFSPDLRRQTRSFVGFADLPSEVLMNISNHLLQDYHYQGILSVERLSLVSKKIHGPVADKTLFAKHMAMRYPFECGNVYKDVN